MGPWTRRIWVVVGLALLGWLGPGAVAGLVPLPLPGVVGWLASWVCVGAFVCYVPRLRGMAVLRLPKAAILVSVLYGVYWAATSVTFHYGFGVNIWSYALWEDIEAVWNRGGNLRWSAFWTLVAITFVWLVLVVGVWTRLSRVWVAFKLWGVRILNWILRALVFFTVSYSIARLLGFGLWQAVDELATAVAAFPYGAETVAAAPLWAVGLVLFVFGLILLNLVIVVLEAVSDILCFCTKMLSIAWYGGILRADRYDDPDVEPKRIVGVVERFDRSQLRIAARWEAYARHRVIDELTSGITADGFQEPAEPETGSDLPAPARRAKRRFLWFGRRVEPEGTEHVDDEPDEVPPGSEQAPLGANGQLEDDLEDMPGDADDTGRPAAPDLGDTTERDSFLAPDPPPGEVAAPAAVGEVSATPDETSDPAPASGSAVPDEDSEASELERARALERERRDHAELHRRGCPVSRKRVARLMHEAGLVGVSRRRGTRTTRAERSHGAPPDRVERQFQADAPGRLWVADIERHEALLNLAVVRDHRHRPVAAGRLKLRAA